MHSSSTILYLLQLVFFSFISSRRVRPAVYIRWNSRCIYARGKRESRGFIRTRDLNHPRSPWVSLLCRPSSLSFLSLSLATSTIASRAQDPNQFTKVQTASNKHPSLLRDLRTLRLVVFRTSSILPHCRYGLYLYIIEDMLFVVFVESIYNIVRF